MVLEDFIAKRIAHNEAREGFLEVFVKHVWERNEKKPDNNPDANYTGVVTRD